MPSKKKKKGGGKSKKTVKKLGGKKVEQSQRTLDTQMERLKIDEDSQTNADEEALLEEAIKRAAAEKEALDAAATEREKDQTVRSLITNHSNGCYHGYVRTEAEDDVIAFAETFIAEFVRAGRGNLGEDLCTATDAVLEKYPCLLYDSSKMKQVVSLIMFNGVQEVLEGRLRTAQFLASIARYFEDVTALYGGEKGLVEGTKLSELYCCDEHTLVKHLRKSIPCSCLDERYKEVKSITKTGICCNLQCPLPDRFRVERSKMLSCARCRKANYCSRACQKVDWQQHKEFCAFIINK